MYLEITHSGCTGTKLKLFSYVYALIYLTTKQNS